MPDKDKRTIYLHKWARALPVPRLLLFSFAFVLSACSREPQIPTVNRETTESELSQSLARVSEMVVSGQADLVSVKDSLLLLLSDTSRIPTWQEDSLAAAILVKTAENLSIRGLPGDRACLDHAGRIFKRRPQAPSGLLQEYLYRQGVACQLEGDNNAALRFFDELEKKITDKNSLLYFKGRLRTGQIYYSLKEWRIALEQLSDTWELVSSSEIAPPWVKTDALSYISYCYRNLGRLYEAIIWAEKGLGWVDLIDPDEAARVHMAIANACVDSLENLRKGDFAGSPAFKMAVAHFGQSIIHYSRKPKWYFREIALCTANMGELYRRAGMPLEAIALLENTLDTLTRSLMPRAIMSQLFINLGESWQDIDSVSKARFLFDSALYYLTPEYQPGGVIPSPRYPHPVASRSLMVLVLNDMGNACFSLYEKNGFQETGLRDRGMALYDSLLVLINSIRGGYMTEDAKLELAKNSQKALHKAFHWYAKFSDKDPALRQTLLERAFQISENSKAFALLESARRNNYQGVLSGDLADKEQKGLEALAEIEQEIIENWGIEDKRKELEKQKIEAMRNLVLVKNELQEKAPSYFSIRYKGADLSVSEIQQKLLEPGQGMLEYFCGDSTLHIFFISKDGFGMESVPISRDSLGRLVERYLSLQSLSTGYQLYQLLLEPVKIESIDRLIIIPDGPLNNLSFEALAIKPGESLRSLIEDSQFLLHKYAISFCFSANLLNEMADKRIPSELRKRVAIFGPSYNPAITRVSHPLFKWTPSLRNMGDNQTKQMEGIRDKVPGRMFSGNEATKDKFLEACLHDAYVQVIAHGFLDESDPDLSCVVFAQGGSRLDEANLLMLKDLYFHRLNQELIGFSACKTASGVYREGEGNMSLARGLANAGVRSFLTTLWDIPSDGVAEIMPGFYDRLLKQRVPKDVALALAKREYLEIAHLDVQVNPNNWAGIVLIGATGYDIPDRKWIWTAAIGVFLIAGFLLGRRIFKRVISHKAA